MKAPACEMRDPSEETLNRVIIYDTFDSKPEPELEPTPAPEGLQSTDPPRMKPEPWGINE